MKKIIYSVLIICTYTNIIGQNILGEVSYKVTRNYSTSGVSNYKLKFNDSESYFYFYKASKKYKYKEYSEVEEKEEGTQYNQYVVFNNKHTSFYYKSQNDFFFREIYIEDSFYVRDTLDLDWQLKDGLKEIAGFRCNEAFINFRGRDYTVWYTTDIPYGFGPWKFNGLPGLILEIIEKEGVFKAEAYSISIENVENFVSLKPKVEEEFISLESYFARKEELLQEERKIFQSKLPKGVQLSDNCEDCNIKLEIIE